MPSVPRVACLLILACTFPGSMTGRFHAEAAQDSLAKETSDAGMSPEKRQAIDAIDAALSSADKAPQLSQRIKLITRAAEVEWNADKDRSRDLFRKAFGLVDGKALLREAETDQARGQAVVMENESAEAADPSSRASTEERDARMIATDFHRIVLRAATGRDPGLANELLESIGARSDAQKADSKLGEWEAASRNALRSELAGDLIASDPKRAEQLLTSVIASGVRGDLTQLLIRVRRQDAAMADRLFLLTLAKLRSLHPPDLMAAAQLMGYVASSSGGDSDSFAIISPQMAQAYIPAMAEMIIQIDPATASLPQPGNSQDVIVFTSESIDAMMGSFIGSIFLHRPFAAYLGDRLVALQQKVNDLKGAVPYYDLGTYESLLDVSNDSDAAGTLASKAEKTTDREAREELYESAVKAAIAKKDFKQAENLIGKINDPETRGQLTTDLAIARVLELIRQKDIDQAERGIPKIEDSVVRTSLLVQVAFAAAAMGDKPRAIDVLNSAEKTAGKIPADSSRSIALLSVAGAFAAIDKLRAFEVLESAVKMWNDSEQAKDHDSLGLTFRVSGFMLGVESDDDEQRDDQLVSEADQIGRLAEKALAALAPSDFQRALLIAKSIKSPERRTMAELAVADGILGRR